MQELASSFIESKLEAGPPQFDAILLVLTSKQSSNVQVKEFFTESSKLLFKHQNQTAAVEFIARFLAHYIGRIKMFPHFYSISVGIFISTAFRMLPFLDFDSSKNIAVYKDWLMVLKAFYVPQIAVITEAENLNLVLVQFPNIGLIFSNHRNFLHDKLPFSVCYFSRNNRVTRTITSSIR